MGHSTEVVSLDAKTLREGYQRHLSEATVPAGLYGAPRKKTFEGYVVQAAVQHWCTHEASRYEDAREGSGHLAPIMSEASTSDYIQANHEKLVDHSLVIPVARQEDVKVSTKRVRIQVGADQLQQLRAGRSPLFTYAHFYGERESNPVDVAAEVAKHNGGVRPTSLKLVKLPAARKPKAAATQGKLTTVYEVVGGSGYQRKVLATESSLAEARAKAVELMELDENIAELEVQARSIRVDEGNESRALATIRRPAAEVNTIELEATFHTVKPGAKPETYMVAFDYHH